MSVHAGNIKRNPPCPMRKNKAKDLPLGVPGSGGDGGKASHIQRLLQSRTEQSGSLNINCKCKWRNENWDAVHGGVTQGDCSVDASSNVINGTAPIPKDVADDDEIITMLEGLCSCREERQKEEKLLDATREGDIFCISVEKDAPDIHCRDSAGKAPLHCAVYRGQEQCVVKLLKSGAGVTVKKQQFAFEPCQPPLRLKAKETSELSSEASAALRLCLEMLSKQEEDEGRDTQLLCHPSTHGGPSGMSGEGDHGNQLPQYNGVKTHRTCLPAPMFSRNDVSIWSILKKCIGMELSKIAMPVIFNEPLSFLQRLTEYMEHTHLIHQANATTDSVERMKCVAAFAVSAVASQWERTGKPFNPLLGETYELIREDLGFRWMSEQVSHHPPVSAFQAEGIGEDFVFHGSIYPKVKFWGKSIEAEPKGVITLELPKYNEAYTWTNPTCCVHNIIVGQLWIEQYGNVEVINHRTGERCSMTFKPCGLFGKELHKVEGYIVDKSKKKLCAIYGKWTECLYTVDSAAFDTHKKTDRKNSDEKKGNKQSSMDEEPEEVPLPDAETVQVIPGSELIWKITPRPDNSAKFYAFSTFALHLNELEKSMEGAIPSTDSRLRPDIHAMENGDMELASAEKKRLEEKQRTARKNRTKSTGEWKTRWFQQGPNPHNKAQDWLSLKGYWDRNYTHLPNIY
ncbi:oxysterol-binding protein-related protein 2-like [Brachionichthys hirsutus]|uniref:oxysterol-binding protein-related protein 2-like n=1 Tax=Brachionichthys hirsutus TaxID=412623 RepID=UPI003604C2E0